MLKKLKIKYYLMPVHVRASFWFLICTILQRSISIITTPVYTRILNVDEYGKYSVFMSWMGILTCFVTMYIYSEIYPQAIVKFSNKRNIYSSALQGLTIMLVAFWLCVYLVFQKFWNEMFSLNTMQMLAMFVIMWSNAIFGFWATEQRVKYRYRNLVIVTLIVSILQPILCIALIFYSDNKVTGLVWGIAITSFASYSYLLAKQLMIGKVVYSKQIWKYALKLGIPLIPHYISAIVLNSSDRIMIQKLAGEEEAGIYNLAYTISMCGTLINQAVLQTLQPWMLKKIKEGKFQDIKNIAYNALAGIAVINMLIVFFVPELIAIFGSELYYNAIWVMPPIVMSVFFMFMYNLFSLFEFYYEKTTYISMATAIGAVMNVLLNYVFIKEYGFYAAGYTTLFCYIIFSASHYLFMKKICKVELNGKVIYDDKVLLLISGVFIICSFALMAIFEVDMARLVIGSIIVICSVAYRRKILEIIEVFSGKNKMER